MKKYYHKHIFVGCTETSTANGGDPNCATCTGTSATEVECGTCESGYGYYAMDKTCLSKYQIQILFIFINAYGHVLIEYKCSFV